MDKNNPNGLALASDTAAIDELARLQSAARASATPRPERKMNFPNLQKGIDAPPLTPEEQAAFEARAAKRALAQQRSQRDGQVAALIGQAGRRYADCTLASFTAQSKRQVEAVNAVQEWADSLLDAWECAGLLLYGPVGTGKDHLAIAACRLLIESQGRSVGWINGQAWFGEIRDAMDGDDRTEAAIIKSLAKPDVLVISDPLPPFGDLTQHQATMLYRAVDARYSAGKPTICTVNVADDDEAERRMGVATWDRLCHGTWKIHCAWPSYRKPSRTI